MRDRALGSGLEGFRDYELLELLLFYGIERIDTKPIAKKLLERFGTLGDVFAADAALLRNSTSTSVRSCYCARCARAALGWRGARSSTGR